MRKFFILAAAAVAMVACSKEKPNHGPDEQGTMLGIDAGVAGMSNLTKAEPTYAAGTPGIIAGSTFPNAGLYNIGVTVHKGTTFGTPYSDDGAGKVSKMNVLTQHAAGQALWLTEDFPLGPEAGTLYAYYPYVKETAGTEKIGKTNDAAGKSIFMTLGDNEATQTDYMFHKPVSGPATTVTSVNNKAKLNMKHLLAQVSFIVYTDGYPGKGEMTEFSITNTVGVSANPIRVQKTGTNDLCFDYTTGTITGGEKGTVKVDYAARATAPKFVKLTNAVPNTNNAAGKDPADDVTPKDMTGIVDVRDINAQIMVVPMTFEANQVEAYFVIDGKDYKVKIPATNNWNTQGNNTVYTLKLKGTLLEILEVAVVPWVNGFVAELPDMTLPMPDKDSRIVGVATDGNAYSFAVSSSKPMGQTSEISAAYKKAGGANTGLVTSASDGQANTWTLYNSEVDKTNPDYEAAGVCAQMTEQAIGKAPTSAAEMVWYLPSKSEAAAINDFRANLKNDYALADGVTTWTSTEHATTTNAEIFKTGTALVTEGAVKTAQHIVRCIRKF